MFRLSHIADVERRNDPQVVDVAAAHKDRQPGEIPEMITGTAPCAVPPRHTISCPPPRMPARRPGRPAPKRKVDGTEAPFHLEDETLERLVRLGIRAKMTILADDAYEKKFGPGPRRAVPGFEIHVAINRGGYNVKSPNPVFVGILFLIFHPL